jgi:hypothetical protein
MLAYILAVLVGTGSVGLYISAFFFPEIHRKQDFIWSGVGFFYALVLWIYARQETGGILVGQTASVALLGWLAWQTLKLRRQLVPVSQQTPIPTTTKIKEQLGLKPPAKTSKPIAKIPTIRRSVSQESTPIEKILPTPVQQIFQPVSPDPIVAEEAWIKLEVKPASITAKPLGIAVKPPTTSNSDPLQSPAIVPETIVTSAPSDTIQTNAKLDSQEQE